MSVAEEPRTATSVLVIGTGAAGLRAAIELAEQGVQVLCVGKRRRDDAHTVLAAGGINAALGTMDPEDSWEQHAADTLREGYGLGDPVSVELLCREAPQAIDDLVRWGAQLARDEDGRLSQRFFGAHSWRRTCFAGDYTGREIQLTLGKRAAEVGVEIRDDVYVTRLLVHDGRIFGAYGFDVDNGSRLLVVADAVVLAAGGHTRIWRRSSSRRDENTGDAMRLAAEAGCRLRDMELVQFHPTGMVFPEESSGTLVTEAVRGEGGVLRNAAGERFMERYDPERLELSARDRVALANYTEITEGRGTERGGVLLDVSHLPRELILNRLPRMYRQFVDLAMLDITQTPMEVAPTAHYSMGGVRVDAARPRDRGGGALRSRRVRDRGTRSEPPRRELARGVPRLRPYRRCRGGPLVTRARRACPRPDGDRFRARGGRRAAGPSRRGVRAPPAARRARPDVRVLRRRPLRGWIARRGWCGSPKSRIEPGLSTCGPTSPGYADLAHAFDLHGALLAARATLDCALERRETRGAHNRSDFPDLDPGSQVNLTWALDGMLEREPVSPAPASISGRSLDADLETRTAYWNSTREFHSRTTDVSRS